ncbi:MAG: flavin reductase [Bacteroidetes bacterium GWF2_33_16]|nr:MAG: flavin reductase [Bacteroidetes bacterium GWE2_32_14]OFY03739.1 MAG: flavin reductase [Bacteroidetes bacterium GWF2_33_16]
MKKINKQPMTLIYPIPAFMVSCGENENEYNIISIAWTGTICSTPPMCYISIRPERHSYDIIKRTKEFVINYTTKDLLLAMDWSGRNSGSDNKKFEKMKLTPAKGEMVNCPVIAESPVNIECRVKDIITLGSHDMFIAEVLNIQVAESYINEKTGTINIQNNELIAYSQGNYLELGKIIEQAGFSIKNKQ